ncbi:glycosyltransferase [Acaryochloris sp. IP29b_bin.148]|uniref:glycosyltransferase family 2 protein n=1 Tax=Acaryochloris sp. IP29b_bin.148 TaxID=2969218 RepID=UPI0026398D4A|nr:glycosyltransferase [Acaryochloris sp. IP29b_bin.148]
MNKPTVTVVIPAYNIDSYIEDALTSLQQQSLENFEALIVDDGSTDNTSYIAHQFCQRDARFRLLQKENGGLSSARNHGIRAAQSPYIALLDGDDRYEPDKLASHVRLLDQYSQVGVVYSASKVIRDDGEVTWMRLSGKPIEPDPLEALLYKNFVGHGSNAVFRCCLVDEIGLFDESLKSIEDLDFWLRIAALQSWQFHRVPTPLVCYRVRPTGLSFNVSCMLECNERVLEAAYQRHPDKVGVLLPRARAYLYRYLARLALTSDNHTQAQHFLQISLREDASIFHRDWRSLTTLVAVYCYPIARLLLRRSLGSAPSNLASQLAEARSGSTAKLKQAG